MTESYLQENFAARIGGNMFGKDTTIYKFEKIKRAKKAALAANPSLPIIDMGVGEPDEGAFPQVVQALAEEAGKWENRTYTDNGIDEFRLAVARYMKGLFEVELNPESEIVHAIGSKSALSLIPAAFINPGDITIMTVPGYPIMGTWTRYLGGEVVNLPLTTANNYLPDLDSLTADQKTRAKLLYLNYPNNPTGASATIEFFKKAVTFARENNILIVQDAAYAPLNFTGKPLSILSVEGGMDVAVELHSMSKGFNMTGWRLSWVCGNKLAVKAFANVKDNTDSGQFAAIQKASIQALDAQEEITPKICEKYERRLTQMTETLKKIGFDAIVPQGSFYLYVVAPKGTADGAISFDSGEAFSQWLIKEKHISSVPWDDAGNCVRFSATFVARGGMEEEEQVLGEFEKRLSDVKFVF
ncbi:MAG: LL-diaminopimelate aminotransferase [Deltaproteobacteria bacterium]|nr:LL-diaminopimelate aminotransferase [Deltaproteobacteria bacterium]MBN2673340.1 LL-diaminopimelate aminotransferase [Deltaproteobacteria bacterium]